MIRTNALTEQQAATLAVVLPEPKGELVPFSDQELSPLASEIDFSNTGSIISFGSSAQTELQQISQQMLGDVRNKDVGPAGDSLRSMVTTIRGFSPPSEGFNGKKPFWLLRLFGVVSDTSKFLARFETVRGQIDTITDSLESHEHTLLRDIAALDQLYEKTLAFYDSLALYIAAGEQRIAQADSVDIPQAEAAVQSADESEQVIKAQELRDLRAARDDLERRVHDLKLTRQVTMQSLPSIRLVQENDKSLVQKINSTLVNTVPLWETQLAQALTIQRSAEAAKAVKGATDLTNELLTANAANLRDSNRIVRQEMERGVFDIEAIKTANSDLIATINESLQIADEGKQKRAEAERELIQMESNLRDTLAAAKAKEAA